MKTSTFVVKSIRKKKSVCLFGIILTDPLLGTHVPSNLPVGFMRLSLHLNFYTDHIHVDQPNAPICSSFLVGDCAKGIRCLNHHCSLPYHWQYKVPNVDAWNSFSGEDNATLERLYCDINVETRMKFKPVEPLDFSLAER